MASTIWEFFGRRAEGQNDLVASLAKEKICPFIDGPCTKTFSDRTISGVCAIKPSTSPAVICCPKRLYYDNYKILRDISLLAFEDTFELVSGEEAANFAISQNTKCVAVFGHNWGKELRIPTKTSGNTFSIDWTLALISEQGDLLEFVAVEVQSIDTTGNYKDGFKELISTGRVMKTTAGLNWENVNKRILPQLVYKGQVLQREDLCKKGLFFVCPETVYSRILDRLGGKEKLVSYSLQPASLTFLTYDYETTEPKQPNVPLPLENKEIHSTTVYKVQEAFNNVSLPDANVYRDAIIAAL